MSVARDTKVTVECAECGKEFKVYECKLKHGRGKFCSKPCQRAAHSKAMTGEGHPNWKGGQSRKENKTRDGKEYQEWRSKVYHRDDYTCQKCGERGGNLVAHHIAAYSEYPEARTLEDNGITLCVSCHKEFHGIFGTVGFTPEHFWSYLKEKQHG